MTIQDSAKDDFLEAAISIFDKVLKELLSNMNKKLSEEDKVNLLTDALKKVKEEHGIKIEVVDKLLENPEKTKELFKELLDQKIKNSDNFIGKASVHIEKVLKELSPQVNTLFQVPVNKVINEIVQTNEQNEKQIEVEYPQKEHPAIEQIFQDKDLVILGLMNERYKGKLSTIEEEFPKFYVNQINFNKESQLFEMKCSVDYNDWGDNNVQLRFDKDLSKVQAFYFQETNSEDWGVGKFLPLTEEIPYSEFIDSVKGKPELIAILENTTERTKASSTINYDRTEILNDVHDLKNINNENEITPNEESKIEKNEIEILIETKTIELER